MDTYGTWDFVHLDEVFFILEEKHGNYSTVYSKVCLLYDVPIPFYN